MKVSTKAAVFKRVSLLIGGGQACRLGGPGTPGRRPCFYRIKDFRKFETKKNPHREDQPTTCLTNFYNFGLAYKPK